jgi:peptidoglycan/xylan/chitin deacetylase (PgdA/CDA1 family)
MLNRALIDRYKCAESVANFSLAGELSEDTGFFRFGQEAICYGQSAAGFRSIHPTDSLYDAAQDVQVDGATIKLPFEPTKVIENLRLERYASNPNHSRTRHIAKKVVRGAYYALRPLMPVAVRKHFQRLYLRGWQRKFFPRWPVDRSVEEILERLLVISMKAQGISEIPFIWFWPEGAPGCVLMTHDVETESGRDFCPQLMDINDSFGMKASFQIVPENRYLVPEELLADIRERGFEVAVHDLNHDGHLYSDRDEFLRRAKLINQYGKNYRARGFRAAVLYRNLDWFPALDFSYEMSVPNVAHLDPQQGGCCTVFPYFVGDILELPVTTTQDYPLFYILRQNSLTLWKTQVRLILEKFGLISFIVHPDYIIEEKNRQIYKDLLGYISQLRRDEKIWIALPMEIDSWWRARSQMKLVSESGRWRIQGPQKERARVAYARLENERLMYHIEGRS